MDDELIRFLAWLKNHKVKIGADVPGSPYGWLTFHEWKKTPEEMAQYFREKVNGDMAVPPK